LDESALVARLRAGDERAFEELVDRFHSVMVGVARTYVKTQAAAEEVAQEAWLGVLKGIDRFEGRSSLKTWLFRILTNKAKTRGQREARSLPFSSFVGDGDEGDTAVDVDRFARDGHWSSPPPGVPEERLRLDQARERVEAARKALDEGRDPREGEQQFIQQRVKDPGTRVNCRKVKDVATGKEALVCGTPVLKEDYFDRIAQLEAALKAAEDSLADAETAYRKGVD